MMVEVKMEVGDWGEGRSEWRTGYEGGRKWRRRYEVKGVEESERRRKEEGIGGGYLR